MSKKKIAIVTATRAEYGLLSNLIKEVDAHPDLSLQLIVTGAHLSLEQGMTIEQIRQDGWSIAAEVPIVDDNQDNSDLAISHAVARGMSGFAEAFAQLQPDCVVILGDRYEMLAIASAALLAHLPIVHIHGGEITEGAMDDAIRHALTKLSNLHFVAAEAYRQRVIQMGEQPERVFNVGAPGIDVIRSLPKMTRAELETDLGMTLTSPLFLVTYHPVTWGDTTGTQALQNLFAALEEFPNATVIWTAANTDVGGKELNEMVQKWAKKAPGLVVTFVKSLGSKRYLSLMEIADAVVGNSSSGIIEAPSLKTPTVNIGTRQDGRLRSDSVIDCGESTDDIVHAIEQALSDDFLTTVSHQTPVYGEGNTAKQMVNILQKTDFATLKRKSFFDMP